MFKKIIIICGMPRSGTSWLGQIFDSSPNVAFRMEPLFSYKFKNLVNKSTSKENIVKYFTDVYATDDDFIHQKDNRRKGVYSVFEKVDMPEFLVVKTTRHHDLIKFYLKNIECIEIVSIVRHPCAVISSWINTDREFCSKGCSVEKDWRSGECRKDGEGENWGFDDWLAITKEHVELEKEFVNFNILKYSELVKDPLGTTKRMFENLGISFDEQTEEFLEMCHRSHNDDPYSVFKTKDVVDKWKSNLDINISEEIVCRTVEAGLGQFV